MTSFGVAWGVRIDQNVFSIPGRLSEKIEDGDAVATVSSGKRIAENPDLSKIRNSC